MSLVQHVNNLFCMGLSWLAAWSRMLSPDLLTLFLSSAVRGQFAKSDDHRGKWRSGWILVPPLAKGRRQVSHTADFKSTNCALHCSKCCFGLISCWSAFGPRDKNVISKTFIDSKSQYLSCENEISWLFFHIRELESIQSVVKFLKTKNLE